MIFIDCIPIMFDGCNFLTCDQAFFFSGERESVAAQELAVGRRKKKECLIQLWHELSVTSPESGLLPHWLKNKRFFEPRSNWLHDCMFDFRCNLNFNFEGNANSEFSVALTSSLEDFIHKLLKDEQTEFI